MQVRDVTMSSLHRFAASMRITASPNSRQSVATLIRCRADAQHGSWRVVAPEIMFNKPPGSEQTASFASAKRAAPSPSPCAVTPTARAASPLWTCWRAVMKAHKPRQKQACSDGTWESADRATPCCAAANATSTGLGDEASKHALSKSFAVSAQAHEHVSVHLQCWTPESDLTSPFVLNL